MDKVIRTLNRGHFGSDDPRLFHLRSVAGVKMGLSIFFNPSDKPEPLIQDIVKLANFVRKEGILALEQQQSGITDSFLRMGIRYAIDGLEPTMTR